MTRTYTSCALCLRSQGKSGDEEKVLVVSRPNKRGAWTLPGGHIEVGETPRQAALRELKEETGIAGSPRDVILLWAGLCVIPEEGVSAMCTTYLVSTWHGTPQQQPGEAEVAWVSWQELFAAGPYTDYNRHVRAAYDRLVAEYEQAGHHLLFR